jgi:hypothetical protein
MTQLKMVKMKVWAGGGWEGHIVYGAEHPDNKEIHNSSSNLTEVAQFCEKNDLEQDENFQKLINQLLSQSFLIWQSETTQGVELQRNVGIITINPKYIDEHQPITSASRFLRTHFKDYY